MTRHRKCSASEIAAWQKYSRGVTVTVGHAGCLQVHNRGSVPTSRK